MKHTTLILTALLALLFVGCDRDKPDLTKVDMVVIHHGQMQFYNHASQTLTPYEAEKDSVVNIVFDHDNRLYYTAANQQALTLKCIDLSETDPQPKLCAIWQLTLDRITDFDFDTGAASIFMDGAMENICMKGVDYSEDNLPVEIYNIASGQTQRMSYDEYYEQFGNEEVFNDFYNEQGKFYYVTSDGRYCLNDQIDYNKVLGFDEVEDVYFSPTNKISPDGKLIAFHIVVGEGEGWGYYAVASKDGQKQTVLTDSDIWTDGPDWLSDGTLVYVGKEPRPKDDPTYDEDWNNTRNCIKIMNPQGETSTLISDAEKFYINPVGTPLPPVQEKQLRLQGCDMAIIDNGKVTFYNSSTNTFIPFVAEKNDVVCGVFQDEDNFYYTVAINDELYLKWVYVSNYYEPVVEMYGAWDLTLSDCVNDSCGLVASMVGYEGFPVIGILHGINTEYRSFKDFRFFNCYYKTRWDGWEDEDMLEKYLENEDLFNEIAMGLEESGFSPVLLAINPSHQYLAFADIQEWMDQDIVNIPGHGPVYLTSLDGKNQIALDDIDAASLYECDWLNDDLFVFSDNEGIKTVSTDGTITALAPGRWFVTVNH